MIPARWGSTRLPGKPLLLVGDLPLVEHVRRRVQGAASVERVVVATDDARIAAAVEAGGGEARLTGPHTSGTHRVAALLDQVEGEYVLNVQCDQPGLNPAHVDAVVALLREGAEVATLAAPLPEDADPADPSRVKVVLDTTGDALYFSRAPIPVGGPWLRHIGIYGFTRTALARCVQAPPSALERSEDLEQLRWLAAGIRVRVGLVDRVAESLDTSDQLHALARPPEPDLPRIP
ncbi:MAG: 3-deoxy-manno-octulosonate cytidylyltransferase [Deltaproteobacteria bacterium]|nr:3-deoxy-manno-octulosonate cytidylyltransferase [Deltaproteobacteria bacterium]